jgi:hypothetical protein
MANITTTELANSIATIVAAQVLGYLKANTVLAGLVNRDYENEVATHGQTVQIPAAGTLTVNDKAQNATVTRQNPADSKVDVILNNHKEVTFMLEDFAKILARPDWMSTYMQQSIDVLAEEVDGDIAALYADFTASVAAHSTDGPLDESHFREARRLLNGAKAPMRQRYAVLHEDAESEFLAIDKAINRDYTGAVGGGDASTQGGGMFYGFQVLMDQQINVVTAIVRNLFFQRNAIALVSRPLPVAPNQMGVAQVVMQEDSFAVRTTLSYNPDYLAGQVTVDTLYGLSVLRDNHGVVVTTDEA